MGLHFDCERCWNYTCSCGFEDLPEEEKEKWRSEQTAFRKRKEQEIEDALPESFKKRRKQINEINKNNKLFWEKEKDKKEDTNYGKKQLPL